MLLQELLTISGPEPRPLPMPAPPEELAFTEPPLMVMLLQEPFTPMPPPMPPPPMPAPPEELAFIEPPLMVMLLQEPFTPPPMPAPQAYGAEFWAVNIPGVPEELSIVRLAILSFCKPAEFTFVVIRLFSFSKYMQT